MTTSGSEIADGHERRLTPFIETRGNLGDYALAASKTHLYLIWRRDLGDIWVMDVAE